MMERSCWDIDITISNQVVPVTGITVTGATTIATDNGTSQLTAAITPQCHEPDSYLVSY